MYYLSIFAVLYTYGLGQSGLEGINDSSCSNRVWHVCTYPTGPCELFLPWSRPGPPRVESHHEHLPRTPVSDN